MEKRGLMEKEEKFLFSEEHTHIVDVQNTGATSSFTLTCHFQCLRKNEAPCLPF